MKHPGNPEGDRDGLRPPAYYEALYARDLRDAVNSCRPWTKQGGKHLGYATLLLSRGPFLDLGCGAGHFYGQCRAFGRQDEYRAGLDCSRSAIAIAARLYPEAVARFHVGAIARHPELLARHDYQTAVLLEVLEHVLDDRAILAQIPPGRRVVLSVPSFPTDGHCRWFACAAEVTARYQSLLAYDRIVVEEGLQSDNQWFVVAGRRT